MADEATGKKPLWKKWWVWLIAIVVVVAIAGQAGNDGGSSSSAGASADDGASSAPKEVTPDVIVTAEKYFTDYDDNEVAADAKYEDKLIQISGIVDHVSSTMGSVHVHLQSSNQFMPVDCEMKSKKEAASLSKGQRVTLIGTGSGKMMTPGLDDCVIK